MMGKSAIMVQPDLGRLRMHKGNSGIHIGKHQKLEFADGFAATEAERIFSKFCAIRS
jgi:hypothetical protein